MTGLIDAPNGSLGTFLLGPKRLFNIPIRDERPWFSIR
jgi:hypothetical protein